MKKSIITLPADKSFLQAKFNFRLPRGVRFFCSLFRRRSPWEVVVFVP